MDNLLPWLTRIFTDTPYVYLSWPTLGMLLGWLVAACSANTARKLAIVPRSAGGLIGLITAPFVHANFAHFAANLPPFLVLGTLVLWHGETHFIEVALIITFLQGILLWLLGRKAAHVGMSGVIFGFLGYLLLLAFNTRTTGDLLAALGVLIFYGGMLAGVAPARGSTSWEGHLFGLLAGLGTAWFEFAS